MELINKKVDRFVINGISISVADNPPKKPASIAFKPKAGKGNIKVIAKNRGGRNDLY